MKHWILLLVIVAWLKAPAAHALRFDWWGDLLVQLSEEERKLIGPHDLKWDNPHNWLVDGRPGTGLTPGSDEDDIVVIRSIGLGNFYPEDPHGQVAELHISGRGAGVGSNGKPSALRIRSRLVLDNTVDRPAIRDVHVTIGETARLGFRGQANLGASTVENYGTIEALEDGARLEGGYIENHHGLSLRRDVILGPSVINNFGTLSKIDTEGVAILWANITNAPSGTIQVTGGTLKLESGAIWNSGTVWLEGAAETSLRIEGVGTDARLYLLEGGQVRGAGTLSIVSNLEVLDDCAVENIDFGARNITGVLRGSGRLTVKRRMRVQGGGAWLYGAYDSARDQITNVSPSLELVPGSECRIEAEVLLGRRLDNHGHILALAGVGVTADVVGTPALLANHSDGIYEGYPPGRQWGGWSLGICTNAGLMVLRGSGLGFGQIAYTNAGTMKVLDGNFTPQHIRQTGGTFDISSNALVTIYGRGEFLGGVVSGEGALRFAGLDFGVLDCLVRPGSSNGVLTIHGLSSATEQTSLGTHAVVETELRGTTVGLEYDQLRSEGGYLGMNGVLRVLLADSFVPSVGDRFKVVQYGATGWYGRYERIELPPLPGGLSFVARYEADGILLTVAEPLAVAASLGSDGKTLQLSWPAGPGNGGTLEFTEDLGSSTWSPVDAAPTTQDGRMHVTIEMQPASRGRFFRWRGVP